MLKLYYHARGYTYECSPTIVDRYVRPGVYLVSLLLFNHKGKFVGTWLRQDIPHDVIREVEHMCYKDRNIRRVWEHHIQR